MCKSAVIICQGDFPRKEYPRYVLRNADVIVCCDGAFSAFLRKSEAVFGKLRLPDAVVGDMDSLSPSMMKKYGDIVVKYDEQDYNDMTKAMRYTLSRWDDITEIHFIGATGKREDHTIGNMSLLMEYERMFSLSERGITADIISDWSTVFAIGDSTTLDVGEGRRISIFCPDNTLKMRSEGLEWPVDEVVFDNWWKATLNRTVADRVKLTFSHPSMALIVLD
ncbi:MAG: thiamine diphosphokinase [Bacteroidales bacterium]|nr:thiamine diphosphokinase [Candidatus Cryptobacteroides onthequi]